MLMRPTGWGDEDVLALLALFRKHLLYYVYASDYQFAEVVRAELPDKAEADILQMVRALMEEFGLRFSTKNFRTDVIVTNGQEVYVYEHVYESIRLLPENRAGGVWLPDELSRFLQKAKQYRERLTESQEKYFKQVQLWGKSIAETKSKFYALREFFLREKRRPRLRTGVRVKRLELLKEIFTNVPPASRAETAATVSSKATKMWSSEEMETLVDFLIRITTQIQRTGSSDLVGQVAETLHRTDGSCANKLADMREKFLKKSTTVRAANLPDTIFDPTSEAYKIFSADWADSNDPYALGYRAIKSRSLRLHNERNRKRRSKNIWASRPKLRSATMAARGAVSSSANPKDSSTQGAAPLVTAKPVASAFHNKEGALPQPVPSERTPANAIPANDYAAFVRDIAEQCQWTEKVVHNVLRCMQHSIDLYRSNKLVDFFYKIASLTPDVTFQDLFANAQHILTQFDQRFGTLNGFENLVLTAPDINRPVATSDQETKQHDYAPGTGADAVSVVVNTQTDVAMESANDSRSSEETIAHEDKHERDQPPVVSPDHRTSQTDNASTCTGVCGGEHDLLESPIRAPQTGNDDVIMDGNEHRHEQSPPLESPIRTPQTGNGDVIMDGDEHGHEQSPLLESPTQTPQTGNEDAADEHSSSTAEKLSSPEDTWDEGADADADADLDDDGLDNQSIDSSDNAWSGSSNVSDTKDSHHSKDDSPLNDPHSPLSSQFASGNSKKPSKRGKDEQYGKNFDLAKKRRLDEKSSKAIRDEEEDEDDEACYDEGEEDDDGQSEEVDDVDSLSSDGELEEKPHPLQSILDSLDSHMAELQEKRRNLIERKEDREWRQRQYADREYGIQVSMQSFASKR